MLEQARTGVRCPLGGQPRTFLALVLLALLVVLVPPGQAQEDPDWSEVEATVVASDIEGPVDLAIAEDGTLWWNAFFTGDVVRYEPGEDREVMFHADPIPDPVERGLVGLALDPNVTSNGVFYVYYTEEDPEDPERGTNHLSRIEDGEETQLLELPAHKRHNGGRIVFDDEGRLFVSTGDNTQGHPAQDPSSLLGKILHLHPDGTPANDTIEGPVYTMGHRNVYGLAYDEANDRLFATENNDLERDEVNLVEAGGNYGWPHCQGALRYDFERGEPTGEPCEDPTFRDPIGEFYEEYTAAPTGATVFQGDLYWAAWNEGAIHRMTEDPETGEWHDRVVYETEGRINDIASQDGALYYTNWTQVVRLHGLLADEPHPIPEADGPDRSEEAEDVDPIAEIPVPGVAALVLASLAVLDSRRRKAR